MRFFRKRPVFIYINDTIIFVCCGFGLRGQGSTPASDSGLLRFLNMLSFYLQAKDQGKPEVGEYSKLEKVCLL